MDSQNLRKCGKQMIDYAADYWDTVGSRDVLSKVKPGYLSDLIPNEAPFQAETWEEVMKDIERVIMPGLTHWQHPRFHAFFPASTSHPSICASILSEAISCIGFSWIASPACTELEIQVMDWLAKMLKLPNYYLSTSNGNGGGVLQNTASDSTLITLLAAKNKKISEIKKSNPELDEYFIHSKLIVYFSEQAHSSVEKACLLTYVKYRKLSIDEKFSLRGETVRIAIEEDRKNGYFPFYVCATLGTTNSCSFDNLLEIAQSENIWLHVDAAYAGSAFICPEYRYLLDGVEYTDSFNFNTSKWLLVTFNSSALWIKNSHYITDAFNVNPLYLQHEHQKKAFDLRYWQIPLGRSFRSLKIWFVLRLYGVEGLQNYIRNHVKLAQEFEKLVRSDDRFEIIGQVTLGLVCFRLKNSNDLSEKLLKSINDEGLIYMVSGMIRDCLFIRFAVCYESSKIEHIKFAWETILRHTEVLEKAEKS